MKSFTIAIFVLGLVAMNEGCFIILNPAPSPPAPAPSPPAPSPPAPSPLVRSNNEGKLLSSLFYMTKSIYELKTREIPIQMISE